MTDDVKDPTRLVTSADDVLLKNLLRAGESELADAAQLAALGAKLGPIMGGGHGGDAGGGSGGSAGGVDGGGAALSGTTKIIGALGIGLALAGAGAALVSPPREVRSPVVATGVPRSPDEVREPMPSPVAPAESALPIAPRASTSARPPAPRSLTPEPVAAPSAAPLKTAVEPAETEVHMLQRAQDALGGEPSRAVALCDEHAQRYPSGLLSQEREVIAIDALTRLGRNDEARARARRFRAANPTSSHLGRIEVLVGKDF